MAKPDWSRPLQTLLATKWKKAQSSYSPAYRHFDLMSTIFFNDTISYPVTLAAILVGLYALARELLYPIKHPIEDISENGFPLQAKLAQNDSRKVKIHKLSINFSTRFNGQKASLDQFSPDLLVRVLGYLEVQELLVSALVSSYWRECSSSDIIWRSTIVVADALSRLYFSAKIRSGETVVAALNRHGLSRLHVACSTTSTITKEGFLELTHEEVESLFESSDITTEGKEKHLIAFRRLHECFQTEIALLKFLEILRECCLVHEYVSQRLPSPKIQEGITWKRFLISTKFFGHVAGKGRAVIHSRGNVYPHHVLQIGSDIGTSKGLENIVKIVDKFVDLYQSLGPEGWIKLVPRSGFNFGNQNCSVQDFCRYLSNAGVTVDGLAFFWARGKRAIN